MAGAFRIAEGYVEVTADESAYDRAMERLRGDKHTVKIGVDLDDKAALAKLDELTRGRTSKITASADTRVAADELKNLVQRRSVKIGASADTRVAAEELGVLTRPRVVNVSVDVDDSGLATLTALPRTVEILTEINQAAYDQAEAKLNKLTADRTVKIRASVDTRVAADEIRNLTQRRKVRIGVDVDTRVAADSLANLTRRRTMTVQARADTTAANNSLRFLTRDRTVNIRANMGGLGALTNLASNAGGAAGSVGMLGSRFAALAAAVLMAFPAVASLSQAIVQMGPAAAVAVPALGSLITMGAALAVGLRGVGGAFKAASDAATKTGASTAGTARAMAAAHLNVARAARALKEAEQDAARQIADARRKVKEAAEDVRDAEVRAAADRRAALRRVADAERDLADAQKDAAQAQEDLNDARKEAAEQLEDLNSRLTGAQLDERQAVLDVADAEKELAAVKAKGSKATAEELAQAQLDYERAVQRLKDQQTETARLREETAEANEAGVEGSDTVRAAQERLADSQRNVKDRTRDVRDAQVEAAQVAKAGADAVRDAQQRLADAQRGVADAQLAASRQVRAAQESLADAQRAVTAATERGATATDKYAEAMAKLSPNARSFVTAVRDMGPAFSALRLEVQDRLFRGMGDSFTRMATASLPALRTGLGGMADVLNRMGRGLMDTFTRLANEGLLTRMFQGFNDGMKPLEKVPGQFGEMFVKLGIAAAPAMERITTAIGNAFTRAGGKLDAAFKSGRLEEVIGRALDVAKQFGQLLGDIFGTVGNIMDAAAAGAGNALGGLGAVFKELRRITAMPEVQEALATIFKALNDIAKLLAGTFGAVIQAALPLLAKLAPVVSELAQKFAPVLVRLAETLGKALMPIMDALLPVVEDLGDIIVDLVQAVMPLLKPIGNLLGTVVKALAPVLPVIGNIVTMLVRSLVTGLKPVIAALIPAVQTFGQFIGQLAPLLTPLYQAFVPLIPVLGQMSAAMIKLAMQVIEPLLPLIVRLAGLMSGLLAGAINTIVPVITTVVKWLTTFANKAADVVKWVVDKFRWMYDVLVGHSIIPDLVRDIGRWFTSLWTNTKKIFTVLKDWVVKTWRDLWGAVRSRWDSFWSGLRGAMSGAWRNLRESVTNLRTAVSTAWNNLWNGARDKMTSIFSTIRSKVDSFKTGMRNAFTSLRDSLGRIWDGLKGKIASPVRYVISQVYNNGIRRMWNSIAGKINSGITLPAIKLGFNKGGVVPGTGKGDIVPAMLEPGERILSNSQVAQLGGHRAIDAMLGKDTPTKTGGNPSRQEERARYQGPVQRFDEGGIVGNITSGLKNLAGAASWAKDLVIGGLKEAAQKALSSLVRPLINRIPKTGIGNLMRGLSNKAVDGMMSWFTKEDKKAVGGPAVQRALSWARTQDGKRYQWGGNGNPSWDCSGFMSAIESVIRGQRPHRRWATGAFVGNNGPAGWVRNLNSPFMIGITNAGVGHTAGTIAGVNVESRGGDGVVVGKRARSYKDSLFTSRWGFAPAAKYDSGGLLQPGATMAINKTGRPERILDPRQTELFERLVSGGASGGVTIETINVTGTFDISSPAGQRQAARQLAAAMKEELRQFDRRRA